LEAHQNRNYGQAKIISGTENVTTLRHIKNEFAAGAVMTETVSFSNQKAAYISYLIHIFLHNPAK